MTATVKKKVTVKVKGHRKTVTRSVKRPSPRPCKCPANSSGKTGPRTQNTKVSDHRDGCPKAVRHERKKKHTKRKKK